MLTQLKYILGAILFIPLLPILAIQGKRLKKRFPRLPAAENPNGRTVGEGEEKTLLVIGESTMAGLGVTKHVDGFAGSFARHYSSISKEIIGWEVVAKAGITAGRYRKRYLDKLPDTDPDLLLIGLGGNEVFELNSPNRWKTDMENLLIDLSAKYPNAQIVLLNLPPVESFPGLTGLMRFIFGNLMNLIHEVNLELEQRFENLTYARKRIVLSEWRKIIPEVKSDEDFFSDGVHPSQKTYQAWGIQTAELVKQLGLI